METRVISVIHVDDDQKQLTRMEKIICEIEGIRHCGKFSKAKDALEFLKDNSVDIAILDVEMEGEDGFWLADQIKNYPIEIIFVTAFSDYALRAFDACALHYILKPATKELLSEAFSRYLMRHKETGSEIQNIEPPLSSQITELLTNFLGHAKYPKRIFIINVHRIVIINLSDILYFESKGAYTEIKMLGGEKHMASKNLKVYSDILKDHPDFVRIHRSYIINKNFIKSIIRDRHINQVQMLDDTLLEMSSLRKDDILKRLEE